MNSLYTLLLLPLGIIGFACGIYKLRRTLFARRHFIQAQGVVVAVNSVGAPRRRWYPRVEFTDQQGRRQVFDYDIAASHSTEYRVGQMVHVLYDPAAPKQAMLDEPSRLWGTPIVLFMVSFLNIVLGVYFW